MSQFKKLAGQTAIYGVSSILGRALNYLLVPLHTKIFVTAEFGIVTELYTYVAFLNVIYIFGLETAFFRFSKRGDNQNTSYFNQIETIIVFISLSLSVFLCLIASPLVEAMNYSGLEQYIYWFAAVMAIDAVVAIPFAKLRLEGKAKRFAVAKLINIGVNIGLNLFFYAELLWPEVIPYKIYDPAVGVGYVFLSNLIANGLFLILLGDMLLKFRPSFNVEKISKVLKYSLPLVLTGLAGVTNEMLSRSMLKYRLPDGFYDGLTSQEILGIFGACYKLSIFMTLSIQAFKYAAEPFFFTKSEEKDSPQTFARLMNGYIIIACFIMLGVVINLDFLGDLFLGRDVYKTGLNIVPFLLLGGLFLGVYYNLSVWYKLTDKTKWAAYISGIGALLTFVLNWILIPVLGFMGSAYVTSVIYFVMTIISFLIGQKWYPVPYKVLRGLLYIFSTFIISLAIYEFHPFEGFGLFICNIPIILLWALIVLKIENVNPRLLFRRN